MAAIPDRDGDAAGDQAEGEEKRADESHGFIVVQSEMFATRTRRHEGELGSLTSICTHIRTAFTA